MNGSSSTWKRTFLKTAGYKILGFIAAGAFTHWVTGDWYLSLQINIGILIVTTLILIGWERLWSYISYGRIKQIKEDTK